MAALSDEHGEKLQQDISQTEKRYCRKWGKNIFDDCNCRHKGDKNWGMCEVKGGEVVD
jgi:hypothetical protein